MSHPPDLIHHGLEQARYALLAVINMTNAHLRPLTLRRSLKRRAMGRLKQLEIIVRRLLTLMALGLSLPVVRPRTGLTPATPVPLPEGTEIATFPAPYRFALSGRVQPEVDPDASGCGRRPPSSSPLAGGRTGHAMWMDRCQTKEAPPPERGRLGGGPIRNIQRGSS